MAARPAMIPSEQANRSQWAGRGFEIWFFVVLVPGQQRALWVRLTRFADGDASDSRIWAVVSDSSGVTAQREIHPFEALRSEGVEGDVLVHVGSDEPDDPDQETSPRSWARLGHGFSAGRCGRIAWEFRYEATDPVIERMPKLPRFVPVGTHAVHPHAEATVDGWLELDGRRHALDHGQFTQMHIWGQRRLEWLRWAWAPRFDHDGELELTTVAPKAAGGNLCSLWARIGDEVFDNSGLLTAVRANLLPVRAGVLHHVGSKVGARLVVRAWAAPESFAGWDYRQIGGGDLHVAQSNLAHCELELYRRVGLGWRPERRVQSRCAALEFHGPDDFPEFSYVAWDASDAQPRPRVSASASTRASPPPGAGAWIDTPPPSNIVALGLTYKAHARETASGPDPVVFTIDPAAWTSDARTLARPSSSRLLQALARLDPSLPRALADAQFGFMPSMLDYEVELALLLPDGLSGPEAIASLEIGGRVALLVANDVTARSVQILGEGQKDRLAYWTAAKSLPGFAPTSARAWVPERFELDAWPSLRLETRVNGKLRQDAPLELLIETPRQMLARVSASMGALAPGTLLLTGTPAGVAFSVPRWKRALGERVLDRLGKLRAALGSFSARAEFLRPGDLVEVRAGYLGAIEHVVLAEPEVGSEL
jgi:2-keto-4-pentenoate hydratase/2-oxohepta-3-ene-1,7-dioic acid hydratase in catechol pathway